MCITLCCSETGDGVINSFDSASYESATRFELALEIVGGATTIPPIPYIDCDEPDESETPGFGFAAKAMCI
jgi:hypothetical protein